MKSMLKMKKVVLTLLSFVFALSVLGFCVTFLSNAKAERNKVYAESVSAAEIGIEGATELSYADFIAGVTAEGDVGFNMVKGAYARVNSLSPGIRFKASYGSAVENAKTESALYGEDKFTYEFYMEFKLPKVADSNTVYVACAPQLNAVTNNYDFSASLIYNDLSAEQLKQVTGIEVQGQAVLLLKSKTSGTNYLVKAVENENLRSIEGVINAATINGDFKGYSDEVLNAMASFIPTGENYVTVDKVYAEKEQFNAWGYTGTIKSVYDGAKKLATAELPTMDFTSVAVGENKEGFITVVDNDGKFTNIPYVVADKVIASATDLNTILSHGNVKQAIDGYYILKNDITGVVTNYDIPYAANENATSYFNGTLDGNGYSIKFTANGQGGLFGFIGGATFKNISIISEGVNSTADGAQSLIANRNYSTSAITFDNCYIKYPTATVNATQSGVGSGLSLVYWNAYAVNFNNSVIDMADVTILNDDNAGSAMVAVGHHGIVWANGGISYTTFNSSEIKGLYIISNCCHIGHKYSSGGNFVAVANGEADVLNRVNDKDIKPTEKMFEGAERFESFAELKDYFASNENKLKEFDNGLWDISAGLPIKGDVNDFVFSNLVTNLDKTTYYSSEANIVPVEVSDINAKLVDKTNGTVYYENGAFVAENITWAEGESKEVVVYEGENPVYLSNLIKATKVINENSDFNQLLFVSGTKTAINGYYVLAKDVEVTPSYSFGALSSTNGTYFNGTLDGNGHKVTFTNDGIGGLFGYIGDATIKNISIIRDGQIAEGATSNNEFLADMFYGTNGLTLQNCYFKYAKATIDATASGVGSGLSLIYSNGCKMNISDTVIDASLVTITNDDSDASLGHHGILWANSQTIDTYKTSSITSLHVISSCKHLGCKSHSSGKIKAYAGSDNIQIQNTGLEYSFAGATRYADYNALASTEYVNVNGLVSSVAGLTIG